MHPAKTMRSIAALLLLVAPLFATAGPMIEDSMLGQPILGGKLFVAETGNVQATFQGTDAAYFSNLYMVGSGSSNTKVFDSGSGAGMTMDLGFFEAGTELVFMLAVQDTGKEFFSGPGSANADGVDHALAVTTFDRSLDQYVTSLGFEDLFGGGDRDYNDFNFMLSNVIDPLHDGEEDPDGGFTAAQVPEPGSLALLGAMLIVVPAARRLARRR